MKYLAITLLLLLGCQNPYYQYITGENDILGIKGLSEVSPVNVLTHLNGSKTVVQSPSDIAHVYSSTYSNSYFGVVTIYETTSGLILTKQKTPNGN